MNIQQTREAQNVIRQAIVITNHGVMRINDVVRRVNTVWIEAGEAYPLPYGEYKRRAWLLADLTRMQMQLAEQLRDLELAAGYPVDEETGCDLREWSGNSIAADHAEALGMNVVFRKAKARFDHFWGAFAYYQRREIVKKAHAAALEMNEGFEVEKAHDAALVMNAEIDALAVKLANSRCYWWQPNTIHNVQQEVIAKYKREAFKNGPRVAQHIVKVIIIAKRIAARMKGIFEARPIDVGMPAYHELPF